MCSTHFTHGFSEYYVLFTFLDDLNRHQFNIHLLTKSWVFSYHRSNGFHKGSYTDPQLAEQEGSYADATFYGQFAMNFSLGVSASGIDIDGGEGL